MEHEKILKKIKQTLEDKTNTALEQIECSERDKRDIEITLFTGEAGYIQSFGAFGHLFYDQSLKVLYEMMSNSSDEIKFNSELIETTVQYQAKTYKVNILINSEVITTVKE